MEALLHDFDYGREMEDNKIINNVSTIEDRICLVGDHEDYSEIQGCLHDKGVKTKLMLPKDGLSHINPRLTRAIFLIAPFSKISSIEYLRELKSDPHLKNIPVIVIFQQQLGDEYAYELYRNHSEAVFFNSHNEWKIVELSLQMLEEEAMLKKEVEPIVRMEKLLNLKLKLSKKFKHMRAFVRNNQEVSFKGKIKSKVAAKKLIELTNSTPGIKKINAKKLKLSNYAPNDMHYQ